MARRKRTQSDLQKASNHLHYEIWMLSAVAETLANTRTSHEATTNAMLESFAIHVRNLIDFFWPVHPKNDWLIADDYFQSPGGWKEICPVLPPHLREARIRAAKEIAHLTYARLLVTPTKKPWRFVHIATQLLEVVRVFLEHVPKGNLAPSWRRHFERG